MQKRNSQKQKNKTSSQAQIFQSEATIIQHPPADCLPVDCKYHQTFISALGYCNKIPTTQPIWPSTWEAYLLTLPQWDRALVLEIQMFKLPPLLKLLRSNSDIFICSNGGAKDNRGFFGSVLAFDKEILIEITGQAYGKQPRSFRAKAYGMLAILQFPFHIINFHNIEISTKKKTYSNNQGLITRITEIKEYKTIKPQQTMLSESDVELQIYNTLRLINTTATLHHVLEHQDTQLKSNQRTW